MTPAAASAAPRATGAGLFPSNGLRQRQADAELEGRNVQNDATRTDTKLAHSRFALDKQKAEQDMAMRERSAASTDQMRDLLLRGFSSAPAPLAAGMPGGNADTTPGSPAPGVPGAPGSAEAVGDQAFARAKDRAGLSLQSGLKTLGSIMRGKGLGGSTIERDAIGGLIGGEKARVAEVDLDTARDARGRARQLEDRAGEDRWKEREFGARDREFQSRERQNGLQLLMQMMMNSGRMY